MNPDPTVSRAAFIQSIFRTLDRGLSQPPAPDRPTLLDEIRNMATVLWRIVRFAFGVGVFVGIIFAIYQGLDSEGYVRHVVETSITAQENWLVGEVKDCYSPALDRQTAASLSKEDGYVAQEVNCDSGAEHRIKVAFYGQLTQPGARIITWRCTREETDFTCKQVGAQ